MNAAYVLRNDKSAGALWQMLKLNWRSMADAGRPLVVEVKEHKSKRSVDQNRRYWAILRHIAKNAWVNGRQFSDKAWHEHFKREFIGLEELPDGSWFGISTTQLCVADFTEYMNKVELYAVEELGIELF